jgi:hypothetical protein
MSIKKPRIFSLGPFIMGLGVGFHIAGDRYSIAPIRDLGVLILVFSLVYGAITIFVGEEE